MTGWSSVMYLKRFEIRALLGYSAAYSDNFFFVDFLTLEDGTDWLSRNVDKELP